MTSRTLALLILPVMLLGASCASVEDRGPQGILAPGDPAKAVMATVETVVTTDPEVDADDPAFWADPRDPTRAVMFGTDKSDGLYIHNLDGSVRQFLPSGPVNNVDLRPGFPTAVGERVLVAASNDAPGANGVNLYLFDPATLTTSDYGFLSTAYEPYGFCMGRRGDAFYLVVTTKAGTVHQMTVTAGAGSDTGQPAGRLRRQRRGRHPLCRRGRRRRMALRFRSGRAIDRHRDRPCRSQPDPGRRRGPDDPA